MEIPRYFVAQAEPSTGVPANTVAAPYLQAGQAFSQVSQAAHEYHKAAEAAEAGSQYNRAIAIYRTGLVELENSYTQRFTEDDASGEEKRTYEVMLKQSQERLKTLESHALSNVTNRLAKQKFGAQAATLRAGTWDVLLKRQRDLFIEDKKANLDEETAVLRQSGDYDGILEANTVAFEAGFIGADELSDRNELTYEMEATDTLYRAVTTAIKSENTGVLTDLIEQMGASEAPAEVKQDMLDSVLDAIDDIDNRVADQKENAQKSAFIADITSIVAGQMPRGQFNQNVRSGRYRNTDVSTLNNLMSRREQSGINDADLERDYLVRIAGLASQSGSFVENQSALLEEIAARRDEFNTTTFDKLAQRIGGADEAHLKNYRYRTALDFAFSNIRGAGVDEITERWDDKTPERNANARLFQAEFAEWWLSNPTDDPMQYAKDNWERFKVFEETDSGGTILKADE